MIISHKHKYLFIEVPHTASTAISQELRTFYDGEAILYKHANFTEGRRVLRTLPDKYFVFAAIRNPLDTAVTDYFKLKTNHHGSYTRPDKQQVQGGWVPQEHLDKFRYIHKKHADFPAFFKRFYRTVYHNWFLVGHSRFNQIIRFENIREDFAEVLRCLGIAQVRPLPLVNKTKRDKAFDQFFTPDTYAQAAAVFGPFMRKWRYEFPPGWNVRVPLANEVRFRVTESAANAAACCFCLSPRNSALTRIKEGLRWASLG